MTGALIILAVTVLTGLILYLTHRPDSASANEGDSPALSGSHDSDGEGIVCTPFLVEISPTTEAC